LPILVFPQYQKKVKKNLNNLILGGAQISSVKYGVTNNSFIRKDELKKIINFAKKNEIRLIDTAKSYKNSERVIGDLNIKLNIITKLNILNNKNISEKSIISSFEDSLKKLNKKRIYGLLIHGVKDLSKSKVLKIVNILRKLKKKKKVKYIGVSIYEPDEIKIFWQHWKPDIIQVPYNIFDRRIKTSGWLTKLKKNKIKVHIRSIFLQGLLINSEIKYSLKLKKIEKLLNNWFLWCKNNRKDPYEECLKFSLRANVDKIIVGVYSLKQLKYLIKSFKSLNMKSSNFPLKKFYKIVDPRKWS
jgi:aryl-alcohol dehydrogenase-like predicted oxidoreductase